VPLTKEHSRSSVRVRRFPRKITSLSKGVLAAPLLLAAAC
jgi:hypothetical protein